MMPIPSIEFNAFEHDRSFGKRSMAFARVDHVMCGKLIGGGWSQGLRDTDH